MTLSITTLSITTLSLMKPNITALNKTTQMRPILSVCYSSVDVLNCYAECHYAECRYAKCRYVKCRGVLFLSPGVREEQNMKFRSKVNSLRNLHSINVQLKRHRGQFYKTFSIKNVNLFNPIGRALV
jgi:hypothetical protein